MPLHIVISRHIRYRFSNLPDVLVRHAVWTKFPRTAQIQWLPVQQSSVSVRYRIQIILSCKCITQRNDPLSIIHNIQRFCQKLKDDTRLVLREIVHHLNTWPKKIQRKMFLIYTYRDSSYFKAWYGTSKLKYQTQTKGLQCTRNHHRPGLQPLLL
jgi:hypothetical protein